jgi:hypothetical protein
MSTPIQKQLYDSANAYYQGATILMKPPELIGTHSALIIQPAVTCAALSLKLYLKSLLAVEGKDKDDNIYRFADLYRNLSESMKLLLLKKFDEFSNTQLISEELTRHLEALDNAFVRWRYIHEEDAKSVNLEDLEQMILATKATINTLKPDWE